jgi:RNA polymerase primary sigma factor
MEGVTRSTVANYTYKPIERLARHCQYVPRQRRLEQLNRIQRLAADLAAEKTYPYDYVLYQITRFRPDDAEHAVFAGDKLRADLIGLILDISDSLDLPAEWAGEPVLTLKEVCRTYDVSLKTVRRWRARGLVALRLIFSNGKKLTSVRQSDLEAFVEAHPKACHRAEAYVHVGKEARHRLIARAFELSLNDELTFAEAVGRLAREFVCSHDAVRDLLERYDREHPQAPIFSAAPQPLSEDDRRQLLALYRSGRPAGELAREFLLGRSTVRRVVRELVIEQVLDRPWRHIHCPEFDEPDAEERLLGEMPREQIDEGSMANLLSAEEEQRLFRQYNYVKFKLARARDELTPSELTPEELQRLAATHDRAVALRNRLVVANLRLVIHHAGRHLGQGRSLDELVSDGTVSLMRAIEKFDYNRGVRFSTYASWAIIKNFAKSIPRDAQARDAVTEDSQDIVEQAADARAAEGGQRETREVLRSLVTSMLLELSPRERDVVIARFGLGGRETETLEQIGKRHDITRERVRQIEAQALRKLASTADPETIKDLSLPLANAGR